MGHKCTVARWPRISTCPATELNVYVLAVAGVLVASAMTGNGQDGQGFGAENAWFFVTLLTIGYMISRRLAKSGSREADDA